MTVEHSFALRELRCQIVRWVSDDVVPGWVEARFADAAGATWTLFDKPAIFSADCVTSASTFPLDGMARCEVVGHVSAQTVRVRLIYSATADGRNEFDVNPDQLADPG